MILVMTSLVHGESVCEMFGAVSDIPFIVYSVEERLKQLETMKADKPSLVQTEDLAASSRLLASVCCTPCVAMGEVITVRV